MTTTVTTIANLKAVTGQSNNDMREVLGYYAAGDGGGGLYRFNSSDSTADNGGTVIQPNSGSGRWNLLLGGTLLSAAQFGFITTASSATNKAALQAAIDSLGTTTGGEIYIPKGSYSCDAGIVLNQANTTLMGAGCADAYGQSEAGTKITFTSTGGSIGFDLTAINAPGGAGNYNCLRNLHIDGNDVLATGIKVKGYANLEHVAVERCTGQNIWLASLINQTSLRHISAWDSQGYGILIGDSSTGMTDNTVMSLDHCTFRQNLVGMRIVAARHARFSSVVSESNTNAGLEIYQHTGGRVEWLEFDNCWFEENYAGGAAGDGVKIDSQTRDYGSGPPHHIRFSNCAFIDTTPTDALAIDSVKFCLFENCEFGTSQDIDLGTYASYVGFWNKIGGVIADSGNRNWTGHDGYKTEDVGGPVWAPIGAQTFTPGIAFGGGTTGITYSTQVGSYTKINNMVFFNARITLSNKGSSAGALTITGLPFTAESAPHAACSVYGNNLTQISGGLMGLVIGGGTYATLFFGGAGTATQVDNTHATNTTDLVIGGAYRVTPT